MKLFEILKETFNAKETELSDGFELVNYEEWDSMSHMFFITKLQEGYEVDLDGEDILRMKTIGQIKQVLAEKGKEN